MTQHRTSGYFTDEGSVLCTCADRAGSVSPGLVGTADRFGWALGWGLAVAAASRRRAMVVVVAVVAVVAVVVAVLALEAAWFVR